MVKKIETIIFAILSSSLIMISCQQKKESKSQNHAAETPQSSTASMAYESYEYEQSQVFQAPEESDEQMEMSSEGEQMYFDSDDPDDHEEESLQVTSVDSSVEILEEDLSPAQIVIKKLERGLDEQDLEKVTSAWDELQELGTSALTQKDRDIIHDLQDKMDRLMGY